MKDDVSELQTEGKSSSSEFQLSEECSTSHTLDLCIIHINIGRSVWIICLMCSHDEEHVHTVIAIFKNHRRIMVNSTHISYFTMVSYFDTGFFKYLFFMIVMCLYVCIIGANVLLIVVICVNRRLHEPMCLFLCSLFPYGFLLFFVVFVTISLSVSLQLCGNIINKVYCDNYSIVKLACSDTTVNNIYGLIFTFFTVSCPVSLIVFSYMRILRVCFSGCKQSRQKAVSTCTPHLASLINFYFGVFFEIVQSRFNMSGVPNMLRIFLSLYFLTCQPLFSPMMYGLNMSKIYILDDVSELQTESKSSSSEFQLSEESSTSHSLDLCIIHINIGRSVWIICLTCSHDEEHVVTVIAMFKVTSTSR
ncbi:hypothetical protein F7725_027064 [Dissostichus mawsoni]|uniref:Olfactory receptor n=1 Tax=Dissostichus mawsoni TaxID=36200 RepID=A0A7J5XBV6_DISMA|nr:hypothetical protein F7725_027064 [Dissostichus mawsoni]